MIDKLICAVVEEEDSRDEDGDVEYQNIVVHLVRDWLRGPKRIVLGVFITVSSIYLRDAGALQCCDHRAVETY